MVKQLQVKTEIVDVAEFEQAIFALANGNYSKRLKVSLQNAGRDVIVSGINMLAEELEQTTVSRDYFASIYNAVSEMLMILDLNGKVVDSNMATIEKLDYSKSELVNINLHNLIQFKRKENVLSLNALANSEILNIRFRAKIITKKKTTLPVSCSISTILDRNEKLVGYLVKAEDITEFISNKNKELRIISSSQEKERKRIAYDLHDSLGQKLVGVKMYLNSLSVMKKDSKKFSESLESCKILLDETIGTIRNICYNLMPKSLENGDLVIALSELINKLTKVCLIEFKPPSKVLKMDKESQILTYRIVQEFISNSLKHSKATKIIVRITINSGHTSLKLSDNGLGFKVSDKRSGNGISNMISRLNAINADYIFESRPKKGTFLGFKIKEI